MNSSLAPEFSTKQLLRALLLAGLVMVCFGSAWAQEATKPSPPRAFKAKLDSLSLDSVAQSAASLKHPVYYEAKDSIIFDIPSKKVFLYNEGKISYDNIKLKADSIDINLNNKTVTASGRTDTSGYLKGSPVFEESDKKFRSKKLVYNFDSKKGIISEVITQEGEGYLHGKKIKKLGTDNINIHGGSYTTCNLDHPHYTFQFKKSEVIPNNKIITGPINMTVADVPTPLGIPFAILPMSKGAKSGILIPTWGESADRGFYFENFGYYFSLSEYFDFEIRGDVYSLGSWAVKGATRYHKRYKYNGYFNANYALNIIPSYNQESRDFSVRWMHSQDQKARPNSRFSANVNLVSSEYNKYNPTTTTAYLSNTFQSSITYQTNFSDKYFLNLSLNHSQNTIERTVTMTLPDLSFTVNRFYPFARKIPTGPAKWYEKIGVNLQSNAQNTISTYDSLLFTPQSAELFRNGLKNSGSVSSPVNILKYLVLTNSINYTGRWYTQKITQSWVDTIFTPIDTIAAYLKKDTLMGMYSSRDVSFSSSLSTMVYGLVQFKKGYLRGIRHVMTPSVALSFSPGYKDPMWGDYGTYTDAKGKEVTYSYFANSIYGTAPAENSGRVSFNLSNNLEIKVRSKKDTVTGFKKVALIDNFSFSTSYDLAKDSLRWAPFAMSGRTKLFKNIDITYASYWDFYILDSTGKKNLNQYEWAVNRRFFRMENTSWNFTLSYSLNSSKIKSKTNQPIPPMASENEMEDLERGMDNYVDFNIPWTLNFSYSFRYLATNNYPNDKLEVTSDIVQTLNFHGDLNLTPRWKVGMRSGWDFTTNELSYTAIDIYRDLHCWEMRFSWIPKGVQQSWDFSINAKASLLQDLKLNKKKDFRDY